MSTALPTVQERLNAARIAYHNLMIGRSAREVVDQNGERVTFTAANKQNLYAYIRELESQLPTAPSIPATYGPATFTF
jgi:hypothetical protein